jgi:WD40 repeat protein
MVSPDGIKDLSSRQSVWEGVRSEPAKLPDSPWAPVIKKAVAKDREQRFNSAHTLTRALEDVTLRVEGAEDLHPYPGLASFTEENAEYFFGREAEVETMWRRLEGAHLLAIVGPSGAGKTSFIRAGLVPKAPAGWAIVHCTPGNQAFASLARAMAREMAGDADAVELVVGIDDPTVAAELFSRWRSRHAQALLIVDQFEELFTLNSDEQQRGFAELLGRLPLESNVHVLLSMRDDFLMLCNRHDALKPIFSELTPLDPPAGPALRRAMVQPAMKCGYRFEDDELVEEMLREVEGERGALPLLAFALARLWGRRDRDNGLLTRRAYIDIGGVGGALARHAEGTLERLGANRLPIVRELFRNLVTAEGTRAVREWVELLSVFEETQRGSAEQVLRELVDARLLTSYEERGEDREPIRRVEIIHESLLANWPRLVRWQTQDADAAQLRDQLRQAARTWEERDRPDDLLWTGSAYREFAVWRESYPGGLSETEGAFGDAMVAVANRRRKRRRMAVTAVLLIAGVVAAVTTALWRRSVVQERRAEAQKLIAIGQVRLEDYPTAALAYATRSLELTDSEEARFLAMEALWKGPTAFVVNEDPTIFASFSTGGDWLAQSHDFSSSLAVISRNGEQRVMDHPSESGTTRVLAFFRGAEDIFPSMGWDNVRERGRIALWSASEGRLLATAMQLAEPDSFRLAVIDGDAQPPRALSAQGKGGFVTLDALNIDGSHERLGELHLTVPPGRRAIYCLDRASGDWLAVVEGSEVSVLRIEDKGLSDRRLLGRHEGNVVMCAADLRGRFFLTVIRSEDLIKEIRRWDPSGELAPTDSKLPSGHWLVHLSRDGSYLVPDFRQEDGEYEYSFWSFDRTGAGLLRSLNDVEGGYSAFDPVSLHFAVRGPIPAHRLWSLAAPAGAEPIVLRRGPTSYAHKPEFSPDGRWLATCDRSGLIMWPLVRSYPAVIGIDFEAFTNGVEFGPDGRFLATAAGSKVRVWPLVGPVPPAGHVVFEAPAAVTGVAVSPDGELFGVGAGSGGPGVWIGRDGEEPLELSSGEGLRIGSGLVTFSQDGRFVAAYSGGFDIANAVFHVWEVATGKEVAVLHLDGEEFRGGSSFDGDGRLLTASTKGVVAWDVEKGNHEVLVEARVQRAVASEDGRRLLVTEEGIDNKLQGPAGSPTFFDLDTGQVTKLTTHGLQVRALALDREGTVAVTGDSTGVIRVGRVNGEETHLLLGHRSQVLDLAVDPLGRWVASCALDDSVRLWPMPDLDKPPLHTLPHDELIAKLHSLTNLRVVRDPESSTGWKVEVGPFPGWKTVPTW